jgi:hypothetical protein
MTFWFFVWLVGCLIGFLFACFVLVWFGFLAVLEFELRALTC